MKHLPIILLLVWACCPEKECPDPIHDTIYFDLTNYTYIDSMTKVFDIRDSLTDLAFAEVTEFRTLAQLEVDSIRKQMFRVGDSIWTKIDSMRLVLDDMSNLNVQDFLNHGNMVIIDTASMMQTGFDSTGNPYLIWEK